MAQLVRRGLTKSLTAAKTHATQSISRRSASANPAFLTTNGSKSFNPTPMSTTHQFQTRHASTSTTTHQTQKTETETLPSILAQQRLRRPLSPHLTIYRPQITSVLSVLMRNTGLLMSGTFCLFPLLHLGGFDVSSASLAASFGGLSPLVKIPFKTALAWVFTFHAFNSLRVIAWGFARGITNQRVARTGWGVVGVSFLSALALATGPW